MIAESLRDAEDKMTKAVGVAKEDFAGIRTGRANPAMFNKITADYYGTPTPVNQLASFTSPEPTLMVVTPYDKGALAAIEKAIRDSDLGVNPVDDGMVIRVAFPPLTEERRKEFVRLVKGKAEDGRNAVRGSRRDARKDLESLEKDGDISADDLRRAEAELDKLTKQYEAEIDEALEAKTVELLEG